MAKKWYLYYCGPAKRVPGERKRKLPYYIVRKDSTSRLAERLGIIKWHGGWRQYVFWPDDKTAWSQDCLIDVAYFLRRIKEEMKK